MADDTKLRTIWNDMNIWFKIKDQIVCLQKILDSRITVKNPSIRNEMLWSHSQHLLCRQHHKWWSLRHQKGLLKYFISTVQEKLEMAWPNHFSQQSLTRPSYKAKERGKPRKKLDNITDWTGRSFAETQSLVCNWGIQKEMVECWAVQQPYDHIRLFEWRLWWWCCMTFLKTNFSN